MAVANSMRDVCTEHESIIFTADPKVCTVTKVAKAKEIRTNSEFINTSATQEDFCLKLDYFPDHLVKIEQETRGQAINPTWFSVREHMISASKAHAVKMRLTTLKKATGDKEVDLKNLIDKIARRKSVNSLLTPLRYGQAMENNVVQML